LVPFPAILLDRGSNGMGKVSRKRAVKNYRKRFRERGLSRFEVMGPAPIES
jgi:hypothetical protein